MVGIGFPKCGTGSLAFFDCHPKIVFREAEPDFWDRRRTSYELKDYILPNASSAEILIGQGTAISQHCRSTWTPQMQL